MHVQTAVKGAAAMRGAALDALRFLAALFVLLFHFGGEAPTPLDHLNGFFAKGYLATDFFLLLSGFVLVKAYGVAILSGKISHGGFVAKRLARNYPAHLITLAGLVVAVLIAAAAGHHLHNPNRFAWSALPAQLLLVHAWGVAGGTWNVPSWTISALMTCYIAFPWLWRAIRQIEHPVACLALGLSVILGGDLLARAVAGHEQFDLPFQWGVLRAAPLFIAGVALARFVEIASLKPLAALVVGLSGFAVVVINAVALGPDLISVLATAGVIIGCGASPSGWRWPGAQWGAKLSFCLFLTHTISGAIFFDAIRPVLLRLHPGLGLQWAIWLGGTGFALTLAAAFYHLVDEPIQRRLEGMLFRPRRAPGPATALSG